MQQLALPSTLLGMEAPGDSLVAGLAEARGRLDWPPGVVLAVLRLPELDPLIRELERRVARGAIAGAPCLEPELVAETERLAELLSRGTLGSAPEAVQRRVRIVEILRRADGGRLPLLAFDEGDAFGAELRSMLETDPGLRVQLGRLHPLAIRATSVGPPAHWLAEARSALADAGRTEAWSVIRRTLASLVRADIVSRPDLLVGGVRLTNQRLARGLLWLASIATDTPAELLAAVGVRMGTSGRNDAVVRDTALANTCAALLGASEDPLAATALASMRVRVTNRNVRGQVERALEAIAVREGLEVEAVIELALPTFGLDRSGRVEIAVGKARAIVSIVDGGEVRVRWRAPDGTELSATSEDVVAAPPAEIASVTELVTSIRATVSEERQRMEARLASERSWLEASWRRRFLEHPIGGLFGRRLIWISGPSGSPGTAAIPDGDRWLGLDGRAVRSDELHARSVRLWHPADSDETEIAAWRATLAAAGIVQPLRQADREAFRPLEQDRDLAVDRRFAGRIVDHSRMRALLRERGWAVPSLGPWDQGDEATAMRAFDNGLRAELRYQAVERVPTGQRQGRARLIGVRFGVAGPETTGDATLTPVPSLAAVPARAYSEAIRDVSLVVAVAEPASGP